MPKKQNIIEQEWSHFFDIEDLEKDKTRLSIEASEEELEDLARRFGVPAVKKAMANLTLDRSKGGHAIHVYGEFQATLTLSCVVTLEEFDADITESVEGWFADKQSTVSFAAAKREREANTSRGEVEMLEEQEDPEAIVDGLIDLGELVTQHISLAIPSYPRKDGAQYEFGDDQVQVDEKSPLRKNPFEALKDWKEGR